MMHAARSAMASGPLHRLGAVAGLSALALAGCVAAPAKVSGLGDAPKAPQAVTLDGQSYSVALGARGTGTMLTAAGARPVQGRALTVSGAGAPMAQDQGAVAKRAARAGCDAAGGRFQDTALGAFDRAGQAWVFAGACA